MSKRYHDPDWLKREYHDKETKRKISEALENREFSEETLQKMSESHLGNEITEETRRKISESLTGISKSRETRVKMSNSTKGPFNPSWVNGDHANSWYSGVDWKMSRAQIRQTQTLCQHCGHSGTELPLDVHHIVPIRFFEADESVPTVAAHELGNLIRLCRSCHKRAEHGGIFLQPNFMKISPNLRDEVRQLWITFFESMDQASTKCDSP